MPDHTNSAAPHIETLTVGEIAANCYLVICPNTRQALIIDPGAEPERILARVRDLNAEVVAILHTHGHFDHINATEVVLAGLPHLVPVRANPADTYLYEPAVRELGARYGYRLPAETMRPDGTLVEDDVITAGDISLRVVETPGHSPGSVSLVCGEVCVFSGDTLFHHGIGRTDLPGGDEEAIYESITRRLYTLSEALAVYPGHGPATTIGEERRANPFVQARDEA